MRIAIYGSRRQENYIAPLSAFFDALAACGCEIVMHRKLYDTLSHLMLPKLSAVRRVVSGPDFEADLAISIGGDGTFLRTAMWVGDKLIPILGINAGHLGFLSSAAIDMLPDIPAILAAGDFSVSSRSMLQLFGAEIPTWPFALNEVAVMKEENASMISAKTCIDGVFLADYRADGLIVSTPTGSTAYNLSVGGPVIDPKAPVWSLAPIAAHSLGMRPLIVGDSSEISIQVDGRAHAFRIALDGRACTLPIGSEIKLKKAPFQINIIELSGATFASTLRQKLHWNE
ncbi:MAG: NAD(+)/NADH kinase [Clostridium sp.]|nr:NAD(+)/NADH kinase [Clostridium sp.]